MIIETSNLTKKYSNKVTALNNVSLSIDTGIFGLLGRNGSGKTTLMRILTTLIEPTGGTASILGMDITPANKTQIKRSIGYLPQEFGFYKEFTVSEIMEYICIMRDFDKKTIGETLEKVNLYNERKKKYKELSGGMKRRVGLAQAILGNPPVLIVDEPTVGVDPEERIKIRKLLNEYAEKNTVLFSTHIIEDIEYICDKLAILDNGKLLYSGSIEDLLKSVQGKIYEARFNTKDELHKFEESHTVISFKRDDTQVRAIVICENDAEPSSIPYKPTLEEVYVYLTTIKGGKMMDAIKLIWFESKKQITSFPFIITLVLLTVFSFTQMSEVFHIPVNSESDIQALDRAGERDFIDVSNTDEELKEKTSQYLEQMISAGTISDENAKEFEPVLTMLKDDNYTFDDIYLAMKDNSYIFPWLMASKSQFGNRLGTVDEVNSNIQAELGTKGYSPILMEKYITYVQGISAFLIFPLFLLLLIRDYRSNMYEVVYAQPLSPTKYILNRYLGIFIPFVLYLYLFGLILNLISVFRFIGSGYNVLYTPFISYFVIYLLPTTFFFSSLIMLLMLLIRKVVAVFPIYILYIIFNMTPGVFNDTSSWIRLANPIIRLDGDAITISSLIVNRSFYIVLGVVFLLLSCNVYRQLRTNLKKVISI